MSRYTRWSGIMLVVLLATSQVRAADLLWTQPPPVSNNMADANYFNNTTATAGVAPTVGDVLFIGAGGSTTYSNNAANLTVQKLRIGNVLTGPAEYQGAGMVTVNNGAKVDLTVVGAGVNASLIIGLGNGTAGSGVGGTLNIDGAGSTVTSAQLVQIGYGDNASANATVNLTNGGSLVATTGNINVGDRNAVGTGVPGNINISGSSSLIIQTASADLNIGMRAGSTLTQTDGTVTIGDQVVVGQNTATNSKYTMSGGTLTSGGIGIGQNSAAGSSMIVSGGTVTTGAITAGDNANASGTSFNASGGTITATAVTIGTAGSSASSAITGNAIINVTNNSFNVGTGTGSGNSLLVADNAQINVQATTTGNGNVFIGRSTSANTSFTMTGGSITTGRNFLMGSGVGATNIVGTQSGGSITTTLNFALSDTGGASTYNLSGGSIVAHGVINVGRQSNTGTMNQTGGTVTADLGLNVGNAESATTSLWGTGIYNVSAGTINANSATGNGLAIGPQGTGTFRVIGDDAIINVGGNMLLNASGGAQGTLAYQLETGDLLSRINVTGTATFNAGAILNFDTSLASPTQTTYDLLTATSIAGISIDNDPNITFNGPAGWGFRKVSGGNGEILQLFQATPGGVPGDYNNNGVVDGADYVVWRKGVNPLPNEVAGTTPGSNTPEDYTAWRARFGNTSGSGSGLNGSNVPEPTSALLCLGAIAGLLAVRRR